MASSNGAKWGESTSLGDKKAHVVLLVSRPKDNKNVTDFEARRKAFLTTNTIEELENTFLDFVRKGVSGEKCRMYLSNNERDMRAIKKELLKHLIDNDDFNLCAIDTKVAAIAATKQCAKEKKWFFDFDIDDETLVQEFIQDIYMADPLIDITLTKTVNGYAVGTSRGFDTRKLFEKWSTKDVTLKRDDMLLEAIAENIEPITIVRCAHEPVTTKTPDPYYENAFWGTGNFWFGYPVADFTKLPVGTKFHVVNGDWPGEIVEMDGKRYVREATYGSLSPAEECTTLAIKKVQFPKDWNRYEAVLGPNTKQFWLFDSAEDVYIDPPLNILEAANEIRFKNGTETSDSISEAEFYLEDLANQHKDLPWLHDGNEYKDIEI